MFASTLLTCANVCVCLCVHECVSGSVGHCVLWNVAEALDESSYGCGLRKEAVVEVGVGGRLGFSKYTEGN